MHRFNILSYKRQSEEALPEIKRALELDPLSVSTLQISGTHYLYSGHYDEALSNLRKALEIDPKNTFVRNNLGLAYMRKGMIEVGLSEMKKAMESEGALKPTRASDLSWAYAKAGRMDEVRKILSEMLEWREKNKSGAVEIAGVYANPGEIDKSFEWLERAYQEHSGYLPSIQNDFAFENLWSDPRFATLLAKLELNE